MATEELSEVVPSGGAAKLVRKAIMPPRKPLLVTAFEGLSSECFDQVEEWLGISSLSALYAAEASTIKPEAHLPGLGLGATPSAGQKARH